MKKTPSNQTQPHRSTRLVAASAMAALAWTGTSELLATDATWTSNSSGTWSTATRWSSNPTVPGGAGSTIGLTFDITLGRTITIDTTSRTVGTLNIGDANTSSFYTLAASGGASLIMDNNAAGAQINHTSTGAADIISAPVSLQDHLAVSNTSANLFTISGAVSTLSGTTNLALNANGAGGITLSGVVNHAGSITNSGTGSGAVNITQPLGANVTGIVQNSATSSMTMAAPTATSFTGSVQIQKGTLIARSTSGTAPLGTATIDLGDTTEGNNNNATLALNPSNIAGGTLANNINVKAGSSGTLVLTSLQEHNTAANFSGAIALNNNLTVEALATRTLTISGTITAADSTPLTLTRTSAGGSGNGNTNFTGNIVLGTGGLTLAASNPSAASSIVSGNITSATTGNLTITANAAGATSGFTLSGSVNHSGTFTNSGLGEGTTTVSGIIGSNVTGLVQNSAASQLILTAANTYTGDTLVNAGTLALSSTGSINSGSALTVASGATFDASAKTSYVFNTATTIGVGAASAGLIETSAATFSGSALTFDFGSTSSLLTSYTVIAHTSQIGDFSSVTATGSSIGGSFLPAGSNLWTLTAGNYDLTFNESLGTLSAVVSSIPESSTYALLSGACVLILAGSRRSARPLVSRA